MFSRGSKLEPMKFLFRNYALIFNKDWLLVLVSAATATPLFVYWFEVPPAPVAPIPRLDSRALRKLCRLVSKLCDRELPVADVLEVPSEAPEDVATAEVVEPVTAVVAVVEVPFALVKSA